MKATTYTVTPAQLDQFKHLLNRLVMNFEATLTGIPKKDSQGNKLFSVKISPFGSSFMIEFLGL